MFKFKAYTDGACSGNPGVGGWGAVLLAEKNNQSSLQDMLEKYVDDIHLYNQKAIFNFVETEFSIEEKMQELNDAYNLLASKS